jgi:hypothetical protein
LVFVRLFCVLIVIGFRAAAVADPPRSAALRPAWFSNALKPPLARRKNDPFSSCLSIGLCHPLRVCRRAIRGRILGTYSFYLSFIVPRIHKPDSSD